MPGCTITAGRAIPCKDFVGGIKAIYFGNLADFATGVVITAGAVSDLPTASIYKYELKPGSSSFTENITADAVANTVFWEQVAEAALSAITETRGTATSRLELEAIARGRWVVFVQDENDNILMAGRIRGMDVTGGTTVTGQAHGDANGYTLTLTANESEPATICQDFTAVPFDNYINITVVS
jgi:hypothetical protein